MSNNSFNDYGKADFKKRIFSVTICNLMETNAQCFVHREELLLAVKKNKNFRSGSFNNPVPEFFRNVGNSSGF